MKRRLFGVLAIVAACFVGVIGTSQASAAPAKGSPIRIGAVCYCSGPQGGGQASIKAYDDAWVKWTNANGGINGHPVKLYFADDAGDATKSATAVRRLINENKVQVIAGWLSTQAAAWADIAKKAGVPVIGSTQTNAAEFNNSDFFPTGTNQISASYAVLSAAKVYNVRRIGVFYCAESPVCGQLPGVFAGLSNVVGSGVQVVSSSKIAASSPSFAPQCLAAKSNRVTSSIIVSDSSVTVRVLKECNQQGLKLYHIASGGSLGHNDTKSLSGIKVSLSSQQVGIEDTSTPGGKLFHQVMAKYGPGIPNSAGFNANVGAVNASLEMFKKAATTAKLTPTSKPSVVTKGLYSLKNETLGGLIAPITYTKGKPTFTNCWFYNTFNGSKWSNNTKPQCVTGAKLKVLLGVASGIK
ncbi:MAG TPA: ABC transporter substrate-binding protein [Solirubrobacteraceae bacterium]|nr:ABC transporter substrate-binding protein [Solirubrobacteraceae bacterium]